MVDKKTNKYSVHNGLENAKYMEIIKALLIKIKKFWEVKQFFSYWYILTVRIAMELYSCGSYIGKT